MRHRRGVPELEERFGMESTISYNNERRKKVHFLSPHHLGCWWKWMQTERWNVVFFLLLLGALMVVLQWIAHDAGPPAIRWTTPTMMHTLLQYEPIRLPSDTYDVLRCPDIPPPGYPREYKILEVLGNWSIPDVEPPQDGVRQIHQGICVFDYNNTSTEGTGLLEQTIDAYRKAEVPFVIRNDPAVLPSVHRWSDIRYLSNRLRGQRFEATLANNTNHMRYFSISPEGHDVPYDFVPPTRFAPMSFAEWYRRATLPTSARGERAYLRVDACLDEEDSGCDATYLADQQHVANGDFIYNDLPFFQPSHPSSRNYILPTVDPNSSSNATGTTPRGIQCRFGAPGMIAESHFDNERNAIAMLGGARRYLLGHPRNCPHMYLYPQRHPFERHSQVNWSSVVHDFDSTDHFPTFAQTTVNEVVLMAGDVLYLPTYWFHHIVSLTVNAQCNTRSGYSVEYDQTIYDCGFLYDFPT